MTLVSSLEGRVKRTLEERLNPNRTKGRRTISLSMSSDVWSVLAGKQYEKKRGNVLRGYTLAKGKMGPASVILCY